MVYLVVHENRDAPTLEYLYKNIMQESFRAEELVSETVFKRYGLSMKNSLIVNNSKEGNALAVLSIEGRAGLLSYLAVEPQNRGKGLGGELLETAQKFWSYYYGLPIIMLEIDNPYRNEASEKCGDPWRILKFYEDKGVKALDLKYFQPSINSQGRVHGIILGLLPCSRADTTSGSLQDTKNAKDYFVNYFLREEGQEPEDREYVELIETLSKPVQLISLTEAAAKYK